MMIPSLLCVSGAIALSSSVLLAGGPTGLLPTQLLPGAPGNNDTYGESVAVGGPVSGLAGSTIVAVGEDMGLSVAGMSGVVSLYRASDGVFQGNLFAPEPEVNNRFGSAIDISGNVAIIGERLGDGLSGATGLAHLFDLSTQSFIRTLEASDGRTIDNHGLAVTINSFGAFAGAPNRNNQDGTQGAVYVYLVNTPTDNEVAKLAPDQGSGDGRFGEALDSTEDLLVVGAPGSLLSSENALGAVYVYGIVSGVRIQRLVPDVPVPGDTFGRSVAIDGFLVAAGAPIGTGSVYLFDALTGEQLAKLPNAGDDLDTSLFGRDVAIADGRIIIGARGDDAVADLGGAVYVYDATTFELIERFAPETLQPVQLFGTKIAAGGGAIVASGIGDSFEPGQAYLFTEGCIADFNRDGVANVLDVVAFVTAWNVSGLGSDFNNDGSVNIFDVVGFITVWNNGCP